MTLTQETSRRVSISALPNDNEQNKSSGLLQARQLTPYYDHARNHLSYIPNSFIHIGRTPHNSYAPGAFGGAASPRHIGNHTPLSHAGAGSLQHSLIALRLRALKDVPPRDDQENCNGEQSPEASLTYRPKLMNAPSSVQQITDKLEKEGFDRGTPVR